MTRSARPLRRWTRRCWKARSRSAGAGGRRRRRRRVGAATAAACPDHRHRRQPGPRPVPLGTVSTCARTPSCAHLGELRPRVRDARAGDARGQPSPATGHRGRRWFGDAHGRGFRSRAGHDDGDNASWAGEARGHRNGHDGRPANRDQVSPSSAWRWSSRSRVPAFGPLRLARGLLPPAGGQRRTRSTSPLTPTPPSAGYRIIWGDALDAVRRRRLPRVAADATIRDGRTALVYGGARRRRRRGRRPVRGQLGRRPAQNGRRVPAPGAGRERRPRAVRATGRRLLRRPAGACRSERRPDAGFPAYGCAAGDPGRAAAAAVVTPCQYR